MRQLTQDSQAFIQQSQQQSSTQTTTALTAVVLGNTVQQRPVVRTTSSTATVTSTLQHPVLSLAQTGQSVQAGKVGQINTTTCGIGAVRMPRTFLFPSFGHFLMARGSLRRFKDILICLKLRSNEQYCLQKSFGLDGGIKKNVL